MPCPNRCVAKHSNCTQPGSPEPVTRLCCLAVPDPEQAPAHTHEQGMGNSCYTRHIVSRARPCVGIAACTAAGGRQSEAATTRGSAIPQRACLTLMLTRAAAMYQAKAASSNAHPGSPSTPTWSQVGAVQRTGVLASLNEQGHALSGAVVVEEWGRAGGGDAGEGPKTGTAAVSSTHATPVVALGAPSCHL